MNKILIVDDEYAIRLLYKEELTGEGYDIVTTGACEGLVKTIEDHAPDLVVLDIKMGETDSLDVLQEVRNAYDDLPVILCTAYAGFKYDLKSVAADYYVVKSSDLRELKLRIKMAMEEGRKLEKKTRPSGGDKTAALHVMGDQMELGLYG